jgi:predicted CXXCH cytochrome family protein
MSLMGLGVKVACRIGDDRTVGFSNGKWRIVLVAGISAVIFTWTGLGNASWQIDGPRFLESVHGENTCLDCHGDINELERHPDSANIEREIPSFFSADKCLACHEDVQDQIDAGEHGGETVEDPEDFATCSECHDPHYETASEAAASEALAADAELVFNEEDADCLTCHLGPTADTKASVERRQNLCFSCHGADAGAPTQARLIDPQHYADTPHAGMDCLTCHPGADGYPHSEQTLGDCRQCHSPHEESVAHDAHMTVSCGACHLEGVAPRTVAATGMLTAQPTAAPGALSGIHAMKPLEEESCARCHFDGTPVGAAAMVLPAKGILCMPCHAATLSAGDTTTIVALVIFGFGLLLFSSVWLGGDMAGVTGDSSLRKLMALMRSALTTLFSGKIVPIGRALLFDVLLQRRLYRRSSRRWAIHSLIFLPFVVRFVWGILALFASNWLKDLPLTWLLVDKNHPVTAFFFDLTGLLIFVGVVMAYLRGGEADRSRTPGLPAQDRLALGLIGGIVVVGFLLEAMRIGLTGVGPMASGAFIGYPLSYLFSGMTGLSGIYGYIWYLHAILTGAFVAYLPFSRLMHIIMAPVVLAMNAVGRPHS